jgi:hypothetical protein
MIASEIVVILANFELKTPWVVRKRCNVKPGQRTEVIVRVRDGGMCNRRGLKRKLSTG